MAKVSILMPACNVEKFLDECMQSIVSQTLKDIEIICVNDGSKDATGRILDRYAYEDHRIKVIHKPNSGYGHSMNVALDHATGEYIGILETDDWAEPDMFERLYQQAAEFDADVVKSNYYRYKSVPEPQNEFFEVLKPFDLYGQVFSPVHHMDMMRVAPCIWSGIYRRSMLLENQVRFNETPGASYQDTSFGFKVWTSAKRVYFDRAAYLHYRVDNEKSSVKAAGKVFCICDEYAESERYLEQFPEKKQTFERMKNALKYESYRWNLQRLSFGFKYAFLLRIRDEFALEEQKGLLDRSLFSDYTWNHMMMIIHDTDAYYSKECLKAIKPYATVEDAMEDLKVRKDRLKTKNEKLKQKTEECERLKKQLEQGGFGRRNRRRS